MQALDNITILDLTHHIAGPYATKLFADFGANVIKVEKPGGDIARTLRPVPGRRPTPRKERPVLLPQLQQTVGCARPEVRRGQGGPVRTWRARPTSWSRASRPGVIERLGIGYDFFRASIPSCRLISISNFGQSGPYRDYQATELVMYGFMGEMYSMGSTSGSP